MGTKSPSGTKGKVGKTMQFDVRKKRKWKFASQFEIRRPPPNKKTDICKRIKEQGEGEEGVEGGEDKW